MGFLHKVSTPHYPQSNGKVEATVKSMKRIIRISWEGRSFNHDKFCQALLQYRNTPSRRDELLSLTQKLCGCPVQDILPAHHRSFSREWQQKQHQWSSKKNNRLKLSTITTNMPMPFKRFKLDPTLPSTTAKQNFETHMAW